jgi:GntR family transcriptional regulator, carbon starvation induced regulator
MDEDSSLTHRAYVQLRADLIACRYEPGSRLNISKLQRSLDLSQAAVREALSRLTSEGLVVIERHSGFRAAPVSVSGYRDLAQACAVIEEPCLRSAIANGDLEWEGALLSTYHISSKMLERAFAGEVELEVYAKHREEFHRKLFSACDNAWLLWSWSLLYAQHLRFRHTFSDLARYEKSLEGDHREFVNVVIARDADRAVKLWFQNQDKVSDFVEASLKKGPHKAAA